MRQGVEHVTSDQNNQNKFEEKIWLNQIWTSFVGRIFLKNNSTT